MHKGTSSFPRRAVLVVLTITLVGWLVPQAAFSQTTPKLTVTPTSGPRGTQIVVGGSGFTPSGTIAAGSLTIGGLAANPNNSIAIDAGGTLHAFTATIPATMAYGSGTVTASDGTLSASATFTVKQPTIAISPTSGTYGTEVTASGSGWLPSGQVLITAGSGSAILTNADTAGVISKKLPIPTPSAFTGLAATVNVTGTDLAGNATAIKTFTVTAAAITVAPTTIAERGTVTVSGAGFHPSTGVVVLSIGGVSVLPSTLVFTSPAGAWTATFTAPSLIGAQTVSATATGVTRTTTLTVTATTGGAGQPFNVAEAMLPITTINALEIVTSFDYVTRQYRAFVPGLTGNTLTQIQPNSVIFVTAVRDTAIVVNGLRYTLKANVPTPIGIGTSLIVSLG